ncbi:MAG TPA: FKBP-type peptidyl-prolyl cis-trans isomerase [Solirubrobacterales bacterium]|nr:FKBP-type peptidyl-prolyl cis-trans isomerase [Solirubrobacterales bacterium]
MIICLAAALLITGCGSSDTTSTTPASTSTSNSSKEATSDSSSSDPFSPQPDTPVQAKPEKESGDKKRWGALEKEAGANAAQLVRPAGPAPERVEIVDLHTGSGKEIEPLDWFTINYAQYDYKTGAEGERQWGDEAFHFVYGKHEIVPALEVGMLGMRVGGVREIIAPSKFVYGNQPRVYLVELLKLSDTY